VATCSTYPRRGRLTIGSSSSSSSASSLIGCSAFKTVFDVATEVDAVDLDRFFESVPYPKLILSTVLDPKMRTE
jgi:hypothetical protein